jgi:hypothetical protein
LVALANITAGTARTTRVETRSKPTCNLRAWNISYRQSLRIQRERGLSQKKDRTIACLICADCVKRFTHGVETLVGRCPSGFHDRRAPCPTHTTCSATIFASVATSPDAMKESVSASGPMSFVVPKSPSGFVTAAGQSSESRRRGDHQRGRSSRIRQASLAYLVRVLINRDC